MEESSSRSGEWEGAKAERKHFSYTFSWPSSPTYTVWKCRERPGIWNQREGREPRMLSLLNLLTTILGRPLIYCIGDKDKPHLLIYYTSGLLASYVPGDSHPQLLTACHMKTPEEGLRDLIMCMTESRNTRGGVMSLWCCLPALESKSKLYMCLLWIRLSTCCVFAVGHRMPTLRLPKMTRSKNPAF